jgi:hypothetical protein
VRVTRVATARTTHVCASCPPGPGRRQIAAGHRYLRHTELPPRAAADRRPVTVKQCVACAASIDTYAPIAAGACGSFCHGEVPCALPFGHAGNAHHCRTCTAQGTPVPQGAGADETVVHRLVHGYPTTARVRGPLAAEAVRQLDAWNWPNKKIAAQLTINPRSVQRIRRRQRVGAA